MIAMQRAQPEIKKLQAKYKGDRQKLNEETMKFYQENKINPLAGCLPLLIQMPIFFALFHTLRDPYKYVPKDSSLYHALCDGVKCVSTETVNHLNFLGMDLQLSATDAHDGLLSAAPYFLLVGLVMLTGFLQTRQAQKRTPVANKQMGMVMKVLPVFFGLISLQFPAGLVLYFFVSNLWRLGQQEIIFRRFGSALSPAKGSGGKALPGGKQTAVIDVDSRDAVADDLDEAPEPKAAKPRPAASKPKPNPSSGAAAGGAQPAQTKRKGLRGMLELPPPPEPNGGGATTGSGSANGGTKASPKPPPSRNRSNKKKRKR
jgi:YidC/Oxa1 family membrane protein insertase